MKRFRPRVFIVVACIAFAFCVGVVIIWAAGVDAAAPGGSTGKWQWQFQCQPSGMNPPRLELFCEFYYSSPVIGPIASRTGTRSQAEIQWQRQLGEFRYDSGLGFEIGRNILGANAGLNRAATGQLWWLAVPDWLLTFLSAAVALAAFTQYWRLRHRILTAKDKCPKCGYDLRATPDRCPECGAVPTKKKIAST
jgi:hypothetical protein